MNVFRVTYTFELEIEAVSEEQADALAYERITEGGLLGAGICSSIERLPNIDEIVDDIELQNKYLLNRSEEHGGISQS